MAISTLPVLAYPKVRCAPVLEITIFATACRFLIQTQQKRAIFLPKLLDSAIRSVHYAFWHGGDRIVN
jgi:hypothetical protein